MKIYTVFLVALTAFIFITPANGQRRKRATQPQQPQTKQTTPSGNGRRAKNEAAKKPSVPCTLPIENAPTLKGYQLGQTKRPQFDVELPFLQQETFYDPRAIPGQDPKDWYAQKQDVKKIIVLYYDRRPAKAYSIQIQYTENLAFENTEEIMQILEKNLKIPVGSWVTIPDPDYNYKVYRSLLGIIGDWKVTPVENLILRQADCNGWRAIFITSPENTGLILSISNSVVTDNMESLEAKDEKMIRDAQKARTKEIFKPN